MQVAYDTKAPAASCELDGVSAEFAGLIATAVWMQKLTEEAAGEVLRFYALACQSGAGRDATTMLEALMAEYRLRREQQDICW